MSKKKPIVEQRGLAFQLTIQDFCEKFLADHPEFYPEFVRRARALKQRGFKKFSADAILHGMRYDRAMQTNSTDTYKVNNNLSSRLSRFVEKREEDLRGFFEQRELKAP